MRYNLKTLISILTIISFLFPISAGAKITPKPIEKDKKVKVITIKKGDTLWDLAKLYYKNPFMWEKFQEFNLINDPDMIFPGEKLVISVEDAKKIKKLLEERAIEVEEEIKEVKEKKELFEKKKEPEKIVETKEVANVEEVKISVPVQDEALLKKIAGLEQELAQLKKEYEKPKIERDKIEREKEKEIVALKEQMAFLKKEDEMLRTSILELEEKLGEEKSEVTKLKKEKEESEETTHFLVMGLMCGLVLLNTFK